MMFMTVKAMLGWAFQMETIVIAKTQKYCETASPSFGGLSPHDLKAQAAMIMAKVARLPFEERAVLWLYFTGRETEAIALSSGMPGRYGLRADRDLLLKWSLGEGVSCRDFADRYQANYRTANRYENELYRRLNAILRRAMLAIEIQHLHLIQSPMAERNEAKPSHRLLDSRRVTA